MTGSRHLGILMDERRIKAFEFASESAKQLVTLAAAILVLTITLIKETGLSDLLKVAWVLYLLSIIAGVWRLAALTGKLDGAEDSTPSTRATMIRIPAALQTISFIVATVLLVYFGVGYTE